MRIKEHFVVPEKNLSRFLNELQGNYFTIAPNRGTREFHVTTEVDYTDFEYRMLTIRTIINTNSSLTDDEKNALEYAISCIKTLADMGVIS